MKKNKSLYLVLMALIICLSFTACGKSSSDDDDRDEDNDIVYDNGDDNYRDDNKDGGCGDHAHFQGNGAGSIAGLISETNKGIIEKCAVYNSAASNSLLLGIVTGENREYGIIRNCAVVDCTLSAYAESGAFAGRNFGTIKEVKNPVKKLVAGGNPTGRNKTVISNLNIKYTHIFENETKAYNAKKKFPMTQKELKVKEFSTPGQVKIKKVKIDSKNEQVTLTWDPVKKAEGYEVYVTMWKYAEVGNKYGEYELEKDIKSANANEYLDKYLYRTNIYYYKVRAYYTVNGAKVYGPFSEPQEVIFEQN